jgi:hypothetical protein
MQVTTGVTVMSITPFERENTHVKLLYPEHFVAIAMLGDNGVVYVTFTRQNTAFAKEVVDVGGEYVVTGNVKREQEYDNRGVQIVLTNCVVGIPANVAVKATQKAKAKARLAKLFG